MTQNRKNATILFLIFLLVALATFVTIASLRLSQNTTDVAGALCHSCHEWGCVQVNAEGSCGADGLNERGCQPTSCGRPSTTCATGSCKVRCGDNEDTTGQCSIGTEAIGSCCAPKTIQPNPQPPTTGNVGECGSCTPGGEISCSSGICCPCGKCGGVGKTCNAICNQNACGGGTIQPQPEPQPQPTQQPSPTPTPTPNTPPSTSTSTTTGGTTNSSTTSTQTTTAGGTTISTTTSDPNVNLPATGVEENSIFIVFGSIILLLGISLFRVRKT